MKKLVAPLLISFVCLLSFSLQSQNLDEILKSHTNAMGYEKLLEVKTINIVGESYLGERTMPFKTKIKRPDKYYNERDFMGRKLLQVFDGEKGWSLNPMNGLTQMFGKRLALLKKNADYGGILYRWEEKELKVSLIGTEDYEGTEVIRLKVEDKDGEVTDVYLDAESFVTLKQVTQRKLEENLITATIIFSNYKMIDGIAVAFNTETKSEGMGGGQGGGRRMGGGTKVIQSIEFDVEIEDSIFIKPKTKR